MILKLSWELGKHVYVQVIHIKRILYIPHGEFASCITHIVARFRLHLRVDSMTR